jgi:hypothetical protein
MRVVFLGSLVTVVQRQLSRSIFVRISFLIASLITPDYALVLSSSFI